MHTRHILMASAAAFPALMAAAPAHAQSITLDAPPVRQPLDENGVDLSSGGIVVPSSTLAIGGGDGLVHSRYRVGNGWRHNYILSIVAGTNELGMATRIVQIGGSAREFALSLGELHGLHGETGTLIEDASGYTYTSGSGVVYRFDKAPVASGESYYGPVLAVGATITEPGGAVTTLAYRNSSYFTDSGMQLFVVRLQSVRSRTSYMLKFTYAADTASGLDQADSWYRVSKVTAINRSEEYCDPVADSCGLTQSWPYLNYSQSVSGNDTVETVTDILGREARFTTDAARRLKSVRRPGESADGMVVAWDAQERVDWITWQNSYTRHYDWSIDANGKFVSESTDALGRTRTVITNPTAGTIESDTDALNNPTSYTYDSQDRVLSVTAPEGNKMVLTRDARGRITTVEQFAKDGLTKLTTSATWPALEGSGTTCANPITCDSPLTATDADGNVTSYTYDQSHGGVLTVTRPADAVGANPVTTYTYGNKTPRYLDATGTLVNAPSTVTKLLSARACRAASTCIASADELVSELIYDNQSAPNLQPVSSRTRTGAYTLVSTTGYTYDHLGNVLTVDGPLATADITTYRYDAAGQRVGVISADPDDADPLPRLASRTTYNADGQVTKSETGTVAGTSEADWAAFAPTQEFRTSYDAFGRVATSAQVLPGATAQYSLAQHSYDYAGRPECTTLRMNAPSTGTALPASACEAMTPGTFGSDRIERRYYNAADQVTQVFSGVGTPLQQRTAALEYTPNGQTSAVIDAKGNRTEYLFDGYDRAYEIRYPDPAAPGVASTTDYERVSYSRTGNIQTWRSRMGETISLYYDDLGRLAAKGVPDRPGLSNHHTRNVSYAYDLLGNLTEARFGGLTGPGFSYRYNGIGQLVGVDDKMIPATRSLGYEYDIAGRRAALVHPDGARFTYEYDTLGRLRFLWRETDRLLEHRFTATGELDRRLNSGGTFQSSFAYDAARRMRQQTIAKSSSHDVTHSWSFNPANQVTGETKGNALHHWDGHPAQTIDHDYAANGLNQYTAVGAQTLTYDANGNLAADGFNAYTYDMENRLVEVSGQNGAELTYDPLGRLYEVRDGNGLVQRRNLYDGDALIAEYAANGTMLARFVHGLSAGDDPIASYTGAGTALADIRFLSRDRLGSVVMSAASNAGSPEVYTYDEFGVPGSATPPRFGYTGQAWVPEAGLYYYKARMYSPGLGRFMQPDPIGFAAGMNWYAYVGNDPVNAVDPTGLMCMADQTYIYKGWVDENGNVIYLEHIGTDFHGWVGDCSSDAWTGNWGPQVGGGPGGGNGGPPQSGDNRACRTMRAASNEAFDQLPYATTNPNTWSDPSWLGVQRGVYERNRSQAATVAGVLTFGALGGGAAQTFQAARSPTGTAAVSVRGGLIGLAAGGVAILAANEAAKYQGYIDAIDARLAYLNNCTSIR